MREINHLSFHQWLRCAIPDSQQPTSPIGFLFLKLPPPPCAVLLVYLQTREGSENFTQCPANTLGRPEAIAGVATVLPCSPSWPAQLSSMMRPIYPATRHGTRVCTELPCKSVTRCFSLDCWSNFWRFLGLKTGRYWGIFRFWDSSWPSPWSWKRVCLSRFESSGPPKIWTSWLCPHGGIVHIPRPDGLSSAYFFNVGKTLS